MKKKEKRILAWHIIGRDKLLRYDDGRKVKVGRVMEMQPGRESGLFGDPTVIDYPKLCRAGMHASRKLADAAYYGPFEGHICRVEVWGDVLEGYDKLCGRFRKVLWMHEIAKEESAPLQCGRYLEIAKLERRLLRAAKKRSTRKSK